jgi:hypothetical protein
MRVTKDQSQEPSAMVIVIKDVSTCRGKARTTPRGARSSLDPNVVSGGSVKILQQDVA